MLNRSIRILLTLAVSAAFSLPAAGQISNGVIRVGLMTDLESVYADLGGSLAVAAAKLAIEDAGGKINGKPIELVVGDHQNKAEVAQQIATEWLDKLHVDVFADVLGTPPALAVQNLTRNRNVVVFYNTVVTSELTNKLCAANSVHWMYDAHSQVRVAGTAITRRKADTWFMVSVDNAFGINMEELLGEIVTESGGKVLGKTRHPLGTEEFITYLGRADESGAKVIAINSAGADLAAAIRQSFNLRSVSRGEKIVAPVGTATITTTHKLGLPLGQGIQFASSYYWNLDAETRTFGQRFFKRTGAMPNEPQAGIYSALTHYFKAVKAANSDDAATVMAKMRELPIRDSVVRNARIREDGRMIHDMYLVQVKRPAESRGPWDYYHVLDVVPGSQAFLPLEKSTCPLVRK
jgi:branched-chain amino acid transport system substrate-binding protein